MRRQRAFTLVEVMVAIGIMALGAMAFTAMIKVSTAIMLGDFRHPGSTPEPDTSAADAGTPAASGS